MQYHKRRGKGYPMCLIQVLQAIDMLTQASVQDRRCESQERHLLVYLSYSSYYTQKAKLLALALGSESVKGSGSVRGLVSALRSEHLQFLLVGVSRYPPYLGFDSPRNWVLRRVIDGI